MIKGSRPVAESALLSHGGQAMTSLETLRRPDYAPTDAASLGRRDLPTRDRIVSCRAKLFVAPLIPPTLRDNLTQSGCMSHHAACLTSHAGQPTAAAAKRHGLNYQEVTVRRVVAGMSADCRSGVVDDQPPNVASKPPGRYADNAVRVRSLMQPGQTLPDPSAGAMLLTTD